MTNPNDTTTPTAVWLPVVGYEGLYEVSAAGEVRSLDRQTKSRFGLKLQPGRALKPEVSNVGYLRVHLCSKGKKHKYAVHRLVALAFLPNPLNKPCVNHLDGDKTNNATTNLDWCTRSENEQYSWDKLGKQPWNRGRLGIQASVTREDAAKGHMLRPDLRRKAALFYGEKVQGE